MATMTRDGWISYVRAQLHVIEARLNGIDEQSDREQWLLLNHAVRDLKAKTDFVVGHWDATPARRLP